jgi:hypothetical protein
MTIKYECPNCGKLWSEQTRCSCGILVNITPKRNGYDRYLDYQYKRSGDFMHALFTAITKADHSNQDKLAKGFPEEVEAYRCWTRIGVDKFAKRCGNKNSQLYKNFLKEYQLEDLIDG